MARTAISPSFAVSLRSASCSMCWTSDLRLALGMIDELIGWGIEPPVILGDGAYGDITEFRCELEKRELQYVLDVKSATSAYSERRAHRLGDRAAGDPR